MTEENFETIYYLEDDNGRRRFALVKFHPSATQKSILSGAFQFAICDETRLNEVKDKISSKIADEKLAGEIFDIVAEILIDGITFELSVEEALYMAKLIEKHVEEDHDAMRLLRAWMMQTLHDNKDISVF